MSLVENLNNDIKSAMKAKEKEKLSALRYLKSMLMENSTSTKPINEMDVVIKHHKKLSDSIQHYPEGHASIESIKNECEFIKAYMPKSIDETEVVSIIKEIISSQENANMGSVMKELTPKIKGKFDGRKASELVKAALN